MDEVYNLRYAALRYFVLDLAQAHILALRALDDGSRVYNLGNGNGFSVKEVIDIAWQLTGHPIPAEMGFRRAGDPANLIADSEKTKRELGWMKRPFSISTPYSPIRLSGLSMLKVSLGP